MSKVLKVLSVVAAVALAIPSGGTSLLAAGLGVSSLAATAIVAGLAIGSSLLAKRPKAPEIPRESIDRLNASIDPRTPRKGWLGRGAGNSDIRDQEYTDSQTYLHRFIVTAAHKIHGYSEIWFDDKLAWTSSGGVQGEYAGYLTVTGISEGTAGNAINISARMGATRRFTGCAYVYLRYKLTGNSKKTDSPFAQGIPTRITIVGDGAYVYDPRKDDTVPGGSGSHRADDQSTWEWDDDAARNPALQLLWYLLGWRIGGKVSIGCGIPPARIDLESFAVAANLCDEPVTLAAGGTEPRYRSDGVIGDGTSPTVTVDNFKATMNADLDDVGGRLRLTVFHNDLADPVADFGDDDMVDGYDWDQTPSLDETFNVVRGAFTDPSNNSLYQMVDYPQVELDSPDGIERADTFNLALVQSPSQAQRLAKQRLQRQQYGGTFRTVFNARGWLAQKNSVVRLSLSRLGWTHKLFRVAEMEHRVDGTCPVTLREENIAIYAWDAEEAAEVQAADPTTYDFALTALLLDISDALAIADGKITTFFQDDPPASASVGDLWFDTNDDNKLYRHDGAGWVVAQDEGIAAAISAAATAQGTADGKITTFFGSATPTAEGLGDLWYDDVAGYLRRWDGANWVDVANIGATTAQISDIADALSGAAAAQATADGKIVTFYQASAPVSASLGDLWMDSDDGNKLYRYDGGAWVAAQDNGIGDAITAAAGAQATADGKVTTFTGESAPTPEGVGDLWYKASTKTLSRWSGAAWVAVSATGVEDAADVTSQITGQADIIINADYTGAVTTSLPKVQPYALIRNGTDVTASATWSVAVLSGTIAASFPSAGGLSIDASAGVLTTATLRLTAVYGATTRTLDVRVTKKLADPPPSGSSSASSGISANIPSTTPVALTGDLDITVAASGNVTLAASYTFTTALSGGSQSMTTEWYEWNGSAWVAIASSQVAASSAYTPVTGEPGEGSNTKGLSGLTPAAAKKYRLYGFNSGGTTSSTRAVSGTSSAVSS